MKIGSIGSRFTRASKRSLVIALAGLVLTAVILPGSASASTTVSAHYFVGPADGVGDSPLVP